MSIKCPACEAEIAPMTDAPKDERIWVDGCIRPIREVACSGCALVLELVEVDGEFIVNH